MHFLVQYVFVEQVLLLPGCMRRSKYPVLLPSKTESQRFEDFEQREANVEASKFTFWTQYARYKCDYRVLKQCDSDSNILLLSIKFYCTLKLSNNRTCAQINGHN